MHEKKIYKLIYVQIKKWQWINNWNYERLNEGKRDQQCMKARTNRCINKQQWINEGTNFPLSILAMVIILDGDSEIDAHVRIVCSDR